MSLARVAKAALSPGKLNYIPVGEEGNPKTYPICGSPLTADNPDNPARKKGMPCLNVAGFKTDHLRTGRCFKHFGRRENQRGGIYSKLDVGHRLRQILEELEGHPILDLEEPLRLVLAKLYWYIEHEDEVRAQTTAWHESYTAFYQNQMEALEALLCAPPDMETLVPLLADMREALAAIPPKPREVYNPTDFVRIVSSVASLVTKIIEQRDKRSIPISVFADLQQAMAAIMVSNIQRDVPGKVGQKLATKISTQWASIQVEL